MSTICDPVRVTRKLARLIAARGEDPAKVLPDLSGAETRRAVRKPLDDNKSTSRMYAFWLRKYQAWCPGMGYQADPARITDARIAEFVRTLAGGVDPYAPKSVRQAISALLYWAGRATPPPDPMPTGREASDAVNTWIASLPAGLVPARRGRSR